ncbi:MAG: HNH endonuclease [Cytophagales bacterium]|nr:HNH endonuclease [Cytophagales bacterium]MDW8385124.1 HNH endonuclease [Flammeovirgaceae bacterium]
MSATSNKVLVLNADYRAYTVCSLYKAFILVYLQKAEVITAQAGRAIRTVDKSYVAPSIIRLNKYVNLPYKGVMLSRQNIFKRDNYTCVYCGSREDLTLDHVIPRSRGGTSSWTNLVTACRRCNAKKGDFTPEEANMKMAYAPYKPSFIMFLRECAGNIDESWHPYLHFH